MRIITQQRNLGLRDDWIIRICGYRRNQFVFVNKLAYNKKIIDRKYRQAPINKPTKGISELKRSKRWSLLLAYTYQGYIPGQLIYQGAINRLMFIKQIKNEVLTRMQPYLQPCLVLVIDNILIYYNKVYSVYKGQVFNTITYLNLGSLTPLQYCWCQA